MDAYQVIRRPLITEKSTAQRDALNAYAFEVDRRANKVEIRQAVEQLFGVTVVKVRTALVHPKRRRVGVSVGLKPEWKKAVVTLKPGESIEFFEGV